MDLGKPIRELDVEPLDWPIGPCPLYPDLRQRENIEEEVPA